MTRKVLNSRVGQDGILHVDVPLGPDDANLPVRITIEAVATPTEPKESWEEFLRATAGRWQGDFQRPEGDQYEQREPIS